MPNDFNSLIATARKMPLSGILEQHGLSPQREGPNSVRFKNGRVNIVVTGKDLWFDNEAAIGGRGPIDLALHLKMGTDPKRASKQDFRDAVLWLYSFSNGPSPLSPTGTLAPENSTALSPGKESFASQAARLAIPDESRWLIVRSYLVDLRCLPGGTVDELHARGDLYPSYSKDHPNALGACFVHRDWQGMPQGATIRSASPSSGYQMAIGAKSTAWFGLGDPARASTLVLTESPIDAISYHALKGREGEMVLSMGCNHGFHGILERAHERKWETLVAFDQDGAGDTGFTRYLESHRTLYPNDPEPRRIAPLRKDWNDDLRFGGASKKKGFHL